MGDTAWHLTNASKAGWDRAVVRNNCPENIGLGNWSFNGVPFTKDGEGIAIRVGENGIRP